MGDKVKNQNYITIQGWMINELNLKGNELLVYAIIYGFSQTNGQVFNGGLQYLAEWTNSTKQGISKNLKSLVDKNLLQKTDKYVNGVKFCEYYATEFNGVYNKVDGGIQQSLTPPIQQSLTNNISLNKTNNISNNKKEYFANSELNSLFIEFLEVRKKLKAVNSERAVNTLINTLSKYDDDTKYKMIENSIVNSWKSVYELKNNNYKASKTYQREEIVPEWLNKEIKNNEATPEEQAEMEGLFKKYRQEVPLELDFETRKVALQERLRNKYKKKEIK